MDFYSTYRCADGAIVRNDGQKIYHETPNSVISILYRSTSAGHFLLLEALTTIVSASTFLQRVQSEANAGIDSATNTKAVVYEKQQNNIRAWFPTKVLVSAEMHTHRLEKKLGSKEETGSCTKGYGRFIK
jgi:activator of 2-hydroxyglutaryl-CoA dehydratase